MFTHLAIFFLLVFIIGGATIVRQIVGNQKHLDDETIRNFMLKRLSDDERRRVITHLGICESCQKLFTNNVEGRPLEDHLIDPEE